MDLGLRQRACVVTGASGGIGRATSIVLAGEGASLLLTGRREEKLAEVAAECREAGGEAETLALDITASDAAERLLKACQDRFERLDVLVNNAGTSAIRSLDELTDRDWQDQWELHVMAPMRLMRAMAPVMAKRGWGRIVNVSSSAGKRPSSTLDMAYSVTKAAELSLSRVFADQYAGRGVLINAVTPGAVADELWLAPGGMADQAAKAQGITREEALKATAARTPRGEMGSAEEIAAVIAFLCSEPAANVAGAAWSADGGTVPVII
jgi:3-oxoacyl-[acyl-carrier protein] reductase